MNSICVNNISSGYMDKKLAQHDPYSALRQYSASSTISWWSDISRCLLKTLQRFTDDWPLQNLYRHPRKILDHNKSQYFEKTILGDTWFYVYVWVSDDSWELRVLHITLSRVDIYLIIPVLPQVQMKVFQYFPQHLMKPAVAELTPSTAGFLRCTKK